MMKAAFRFDKKYNPQVLADERLSLVSREGNSVVVEGSFFDILQLKNYPFVKDLKEVK